MRNLFVCKPENNSGNQSVSDRCVCVRFSMFASVCECRVHAMAITEACSEALSCPSLHSQEEVLCGPPVGPIM